MIQTVFIYIDLFYLAYCLKGSDVISDKTSLFLWRIETKVTSRHENLKVNAERRNGIFT